MKMKITMAAVILLVSAGIAHAKTNISCTDSIKSLNKTATMNWEAVCPVNCTSGSVWGTDVYTTDSAICVAAVHVGVVGEKGGKVRVRLAPGRPAYVGSFRHGVTSNGWGAYDQSFTVQPY